MKLIRQPEIEIQNEFILIRCALEHVAIVRALPGVRMHQGKYFLPMTPADCWRLEKAFVGKLSMDETCREEWTRLVDSHDMAMQGQAQGLPSILHGAPEEWPPIPRTRVDPWKHQLRMFWQTAKSFGGVAGMPRRRAGRALAAGMGCIDGEAIVTVNRGGNARRYTLEKLYQGFHYIWRRDIPTRVRCLTGDRFGLNEALDVLDQGVRPVLKLTLESGKTIRATDNHEIYTPNGWRRMDELAPGNTVLTNLDSPNVVITPREDRVVSVVPDGKTRVYDLVMAAPHHNFVSNGIVVHNCGKTKSVIDVMENLSLCYVLIVCPLKVVSVWPDEFKKHALREWVICALDDKYSTKEKVQKLKAAQNEADRFKRPLAVIVNYQSVWRAPLAQELQSNMWDLMVCDESHKAKDHSGVSSRYLHKLSRCCTNVLGLSGTFFHHAPTDVFAQYRIIDQNVYGPLWTPFHKKYVITAQHNPHMVVGYQNLDDLGRLFHSRATVVPQSVLNLPEPIHITREFELSPEAREIYDEFDREFQVYVGDALATASNVLVKGLRLRQLTGGWLKRDDGVYERIDTGKEELLSELVDDIGSEAFVVFCQFTKDIETVHRVCESYGIECLEVSGRADDYQAWKGGRGQALAVQMDSGSEGVDLTRARIAVYFSVGYSLGTFDQSLARIRRPGQTKICSLYHLIAKDTCDPDVYDAIRARRDLLQSIVKRGKAA